MNPRILIISTLFLTGVSLGAEELKADFSAYNWVPGKPIDGLVMAKGSPVVWQTTPNLAAAFDGSGGVGVTDNAGFMGRVPVPASGDVITVEAEVRTLDPFGKAAWIGVGLGNSTLRGKDVNVAWGEGIFVLMDTSGQFQCVFNPSAGDQSKAVQFRAGPIEDFSPTAFVRLALDYNKAKNTVSIRVGGKTVLKDFALNTRDFKPTVTTAGFSGYGLMASNLNVRNFSLKY